VERAWGPNMDNLTGVLETFFAQVPVGWRPTVGFLVLLLISASIAANVVNPILQLFQSIGSGLAAIFGWIYKQLSKLWAKQQPPKPDNLDPEPIPDETTVWERSVPAVLSLPVATHRGGTPIVAVVNMKGGVGKTTLTANLAAYYQEKSDKPVLIIDFDYQGSLTDTVSGQAGLSKSVRDLRAHTLIMGHLDASQTLAHARSLKNGLDKV
jgi:hypothetical protein